MADHDALIAIIQALQALNSTDQPDNRRLRNALNDIGTAAETARLGTSGLQAVAPGGPTIRATAGTPTVVAANTAQAVTPLVRFVSVRAGTVAVTQSQPPSGQFRTSGADILDRSGNVFIPIGANVGMTANFDWRGVADGHSADAVAWGWNIIRLTIFVGTSATWMYRSQFGFAALRTKVNSIVAEYTAAGIVVMIEAHDTYATSTAEITEFWAAMADDHKTNDRVWFNPLNEPYWNESSTWLSTHNTLYTLIRTTHGAPNIMVFDVLNAGNDQGWDGAPLIYSAGLGPTFISGKTNVVFAHHNYAGNGSSYYAAVRAAGLPMLVGEFGYTIDGSSTAGSYALNTAGAAAVFANAISAKVGAIVWHGTHGDLYSLKNSGNAFYADGGPNANLSALGNSMWNLVSHTGAAGAISPVGPTITVTAGTPTVTGGAAGSSSFGWFDFDGTDDFMTFPLAAIPSGGHVTLAAWFKIEGNGQGAAGPRIIQIEAGTGGSAQGAVQMGLDSVTSNSPYHLWAACESTASFAYGSSTVATYATGMAWAFVVAAFDSGTGQWTIYTGNETTAMSSASLQARGDGISQTFTGTRRSGSGTITIGNRTDLIRTFNGKISGFAVWNGVKLTLAQAEAVRAGWGARTVPGTPMISSAMAANPPSDDSGNGLGTGWTVTAPTFGTTSPPTV